MEDSKLKRSKIDFVVHCIVDKVNNDVNVGCFCIFDGHGGK